jgi:hypothetical protein
MINNEKRLLIFGFSISFSILLLILILYSLSIISGMILKSIGIGFLLSFLNFVIGLLLIKFSISQSEKIFFFALWGGMLFRLVLGLSLILISLIFLEISTYGFIFSILFFYVFYLIIEIFYLNLGRKSHFGDK